LVAVSGGLDSVVLCHLLHATGFRFAIAHFNFQLRGAESERDEAFVRTLASRYDVPVFINRSDTRSFADELKISIQEAARKLRYDWFRQCLHSDAFNTYFSAFHKNRHLKYRSLVLTAHHRDDNIETVLFNLFRGTGITGLRGMLPVNEEIVRPLLFTSRETLSAYAIEHQLKWVEDSSNLETKYSRNFIRHKVIPLVESLIPTVKENMTDNIGRFSEATKIFEEAIQSYRRKLLFNKNEEWMIPVEKLRLQKTIPTILFELIHPFGFTSGQLKDAMGLMDGQTGSYIHSGTHRLLRNRNWLIISPLQSNEFKTVIIEESETHLLFFGGMMHLKRKNLTHEVKYGTDPYKVMLDAGEIRYPLILRKWKTGDYFYPLGMQKKKKLSRFFIDLKLSKNQKEEILVLESDKRIIWIPGIRIDDRFKVKPSSKDCLELEFIKS
jgi:tRNA(Ile)-lysidine synthase